MPSYIDNVTMDQPQPSFLQRLGAGANQFASNPDLAMALLANSGYGPKRSFGQVLGQSALQAQQMGQQRQDDEFKRQYMQAQMAAMQQKQQGPSSVQEYEYAKKNGYTGSFQDWTTVSGQTSRPSSVQEWEFYNSLPQDQKQLYLEMKRNPNFTVKDVNQVPTSIQQSIVNGVSAQPLSTLASETEAAGAIKQAEAQAGAVGKGRGDITAGIETKGSNAVSTIGTLDLADPLIDAATGSMIGAGRDKLLAAFGKAPDSAQAIAQLRVLQANLMTSMPRMEGPQSDRDVELYRQAAGQIGDPEVPAPIKKAAVRTIRQLQQKYIDRAGTKTGGAAEDPLGIR